MGRVGGAFALLFCFAATAEMLTIIWANPLDSLAKPHAFIVTEMVLAGVAVFALSALEGRLGAFLRSSPLRFIYRPVRLPLLVRAPVAAGVAVSCVIFSFFATMDVLGSYSGPGSSLSTYPALGQAYSALGLSYFSPWTAGVAAFTFFTLSILGLTALVAGRGVAPALRDVVTYFAAPVLVAFELGLLSYAPDDMTWHVTKFLWIGGIDDRGFRSISLAAGVKYYPINNWLMLSVALCVLAARIPGLLRKRPDAGASPHA